MPEIDGLIHRDGNAGHIAGQGAERAHMGAIVGDGWTKDTVTRCLLGRLESGPMVEEGLIEHIGRRGQEFGKPTFGKHPLRNAHWIADRALAFDVDTDRPPWTHHEQGQSMTVRQVALERDAGRL